VLSASATSFADVEVVAVVLRLDEGTSSCQSTATTSVTPLYAAHTAVQLPARSAMRGVVKAPTKLVAAWLQKRLSFYHRSYVVPSLSRQMFGV
jgi:hypothetical protein